MRRPVNGFEPVSLSNSHLIELSPAEQTIVRNVIETLPVPSHPDDICDELLNAVQLKQRDLPIGLTGPLLSFRRRPNPNGCLIIRNLPTDPELPQTPVDGRPAPEKKSWFSEYSLLLCMLYLGEPVSFLDEKEGVLIQDICPVKGQEKKQENVGSCYLEFHTEDGFHPYKPDYVGLVCLRPDHEGMARTTAASIRNVLPWLPLTAVEMGNSQDCHFIPL